MTTPREWEKTFASEYRPRRRPRNIEIGARGCCLCRLHQRSVPWLLLAVARNTCRIFSINRIGMVV